MVRGDERYARSTKVVLAEGSRTIEDTYFDLNVTVDVLRDVGESSIVIYDNEEVVYVIDDWKSTDTARTIKLTHLVYDVDHIFTAKYIGNQSCSPSLSNSLKINIEDTNIAKSTLTITNVETQVNPSSTQTLNITLTNDEGISTYNAQQPIKIYYDNTLLTTLTTNNSGKANYELSNGNIGLHELYVVFDGSRNLKTSSLNYQISTGYQFTDVGYDEVFIYKESKNFKFKVKNWLNTTQTSGTVYLEKLNSNQWEEIGSKEITSSTINRIAYTPLKEETYRLRYDDPNTSNSYYSAELKPRFVKPSDLTVTANPTPFGKNQQSLITIQTNSPYANTEIFCEGSVIEDLYDGSYSNTFLTDGTGKVTIPYIGNGKGEKQLITRFGVLYDDFTSMDYIQYWSLNRTINQNSNLTSDKLLKYNNFWRIVSSVNSFAFNDIEDDIDYTVEINGVNSSVPVFITCFEDWSQNPHFTVLDGVLGVNTDKGRRAILEPVYNRLSNAKITISRKSGTVTVTVGRNDGTGFIYYSVSIPSQENELPAIGWLYQSNGGTLDFTEIKIWED